jgi:hypothetical protein
MFSLKSYFLAGLFWGLFLFSATISSQPTPLVESPNWVRYDTLRLPQHFLDEALETLHTLQLYKQVVENPQAKLTRRFVENPYQEGQIDTVLHVKLPEAEYEFYCMEGQILLLKALIAEPRYEVLQGISVGMQKNVFLRQFALQAQTLNPNVVVLVEDEFDTYFYAFLFENEVLVSLLYQGYLD